MKELPIIDSFSGKYHFLSNFYLVDIMFSGEIYPSVEHAFQAAKTKNKDLRKKIRLANNPALARKYGRELQLRPDWEDMKLGVMLLLLQRKFKKIELKKYLLSTGKALLLEGNDGHDNQFGSCFCHKCENIRGENKLGKLLMLVRKQLRQGLI
jgi:ribA/ribD-fused uncharacterized protein